MERGGMSIRTTILLGCLALTCVALALGGFTQRAQRELGGIATQLYDDSLLAMNHLRAAQTGLARAEAAFRRQAELAGEAGPAHHSLAARLHAVGEDLGLARTRAMSPEAAAIADRLAAELERLGTVARSFSSGAAPLLEAIAAAERSFDIAVEVYAADALHHRMEAGRLVESAARRTWWALALSAAATLLIAILLARFIVTPLRQALRIADAIAAGRLDNRIEVRGTGEPAQLLRALAVVQSNLAAAMARIQALMPAQELQPADQIALQHARFDAALSHMGQGLCLFGADERLVVVNRRFVELFGAPRLGAPAREIFMADGLDALLPPPGAPAEAASAFTARLADGRCIAVAHRPVEGGGWVATYEDVTERQRAEARLAHMARHDALTGLANRAALREHVTRALARAGCGGGLAVLCLGLDRLELVNESLDHQAGDALLREVASRLRRCVAETDLVVRLGGDEFAVVQTGAAPAADAAATAARMLAALDAAVRLDGRRIAVGASIGIALAGPETADAGALMRCADLALQHAKAAGHGTFRFFEPEMDEQPRLRRELEIDLRAAFSRGELTLVYQPLVNVELETVGGFEALLRWRHPLRGSVAPAVFIPVAEESGMIAAIGTWVIRKACADAARWPVPLKVAVNLSPAQFRDRSLPGIVAGALAETGLAPARLELEITESLLLRDDSMVLEILHLLRALGVRIAMDDFGTGYSSLSYLRRFPFDKIKIDQSFVGGMTEQEDCAAIVRSVVSLGRSLGMAVNAEGVETREQFRILRALGCGEVQGFLFSPPRPVTEIQAMLRCLDALAPEEPAGRYAVGN